MTHDRHADDVAAYALGALNELEAAAFERHLMRCESCARELEELRVAVDALPDAAPFHPAPPELRESVMEVVRREAGERQEPARPSLAERLRPLRHRRPALALAAALAAAALLAAGYGLGMTGSGSDREAVVAAVDRTQVPGARAEFVSEDDIGVLKAERLPRLSGGEVYVVWVDHGNGPVYESAFDVQPDGSGEAAVAGVEGIERVMVTREASTAVDHPSSSPLLTAELS